MYSEKPFEIESTSATPMMPIEPAKLVRNVLPFFVKRFFSDKNNAVQKLREDLFFTFFATVFDCLFDAKLFSKFKKSDN